jgi:GTP-binding protein
MSTPIIAIVGRPNVGKSTLFNRVVESRQAIVEDMPGVTRDRQYGEADLFGRRCIIVDTGGIEPTTPETEAMLFKSMREQAEIAIDEADAILCVFDGPAGALPQDKDVVRMLKRTKKPVFWVVNKIDGPRHDPLVADFYELGVWPLFPISAQHAGGTLDLLEAVAAALPPEGEEEDVAHPDAIRVAIVGRPNVGKSTLLNRLIGEERMIVSEVSGTTRDSIDTPYVRKRADGTEGRYLMIDTAGVRRRKWVKTSVEKISVVRTFRAIDRAQVCLFLLDAETGVTEQDQRLAGLIAEKGRACIILLNKWDALGKKDNATFGEQIKKLQGELEFMKWAPILTISGLKGQRTHKIMDLVDKAYRAFTQRIPTGELNRVFEQILHVHQPPVVKARRLKMYYATQVAVAPPRFVIWCNDPDGVHFSYRRFLVNRFRTHWDFEGTPIKLHVRARTRRTPVPAELLDKAREAEASAREDELLELDTLAPEDELWDGQEDFAVEPEEATDRDDWKAPKGSEDDWASETWEVLGDEDED